MLLYQQYGEIFRLDLVGAFENPVTLKQGFLMWPWHFQDRRVVVVNSYELLHEICNDKRFPKAIAAHIKEVSALVHDGLFTCVDPVRPR